MTYLIFTAWIAALVALAGELDNLISHRVLSRFRMQLPHVSWFIPPLATAGLPGFGQFLNAQPIKALFIFLWPFATAIGVGVFRPWQLILVKTPFFLFPWWVVAIADAAIVSYLTNGRKQRSYDEAVETSNIKNRPTDMARYLERRQRKDQD